MENRFKISREFSTAPGPRYIREGNWSGELFRKEYLSLTIKQALDTKTRLEIDLDGTSGYGTSFLEEAFGGLIREEGLDYHAIMKYVSFISTEEEYLIDDIKNYLLDASKKTKK